MKVKDWGDEITRRSWERSRVNWEAQLWDRWVGGWDNRTESGDIWWAAEERQVLEEMKGKTWPGRREQGLETGGRKWEADGDSSRCLVLLPTVFKQAHSLYIFIFTTIVSFLLYLQRAVIQFDRTGHTWGRILDVRSLVKQFHKQITFGLAIQLYSYCIRRLEN